MTAMVKSVAALDNFGLELAYVLLMPSGGACRQVGIVEQTFTCELQRLRSCSRSIVG